MKKHTIRLFAQLLGIVMVITGLSLYFFVAQYGRFLLDSTSQSLVTHFIETEFFSLDYEVSIARTLSTLIVTSGERRVEVEFTSSEEEAIQSVALHRASFAARNLTPPGLRHKGALVFVFSPSSEETADIVDQFDSPDHVNKRLCADALIKSVKTSRRTVEAYAASHPGLYGNLLNPIFHSLYAVSAIMFVRPLLSSTWLTVFVGNLGLTIVGVLMVIVARIWRVRR